MLTIQILHVGDRATASVGDGGPIYTGATPEEALGRCLLSNGNWRRAGVEVEVTYGAPPFAAWPAPAVVATPVVVPVKSGPTIKPLTDATLAEMAEAYEPSDITAIDEVA